MEEVHLIKSLQNGDENAYRIAIELYGNMVYHTSLSIIQNTEDAQDISQDVFVEVFQSIGKFEQKSSLKTWIYRITVTKTLDEVKRAKSKKRGSLFTRVFKNKEERSIPDIPHFDHPGVQLEQKETAAILFFAIEKLPDKQRIAFTLHKVEQLSYQEIADIMKLSLSSVESLLFRAKKNLQLLLETYYTENK